MAKEVKEVCQGSRFKNINEGDVSKVEIEDAFRRQHAAEAREQMGKKLEDIKNEEILEAKEFMRTNCVAVYFRLRTNMIECKANMKGRHRPKN